MLNRHLGIIAAVLVLICTALGYLLISSDAGKKADTATRTRITGAFHAVRTVLELDAQAVKAYSQLFARGATKVFDGFEKAKKGVEAEIAKAEDKLPENWSPDFVAILNTQKTIVWGRLDSDVAKPRTAPHYPTNLRIKDKFVADVLSGKGEFKVGTLSLPGDVFRKPLKVVAAPLMGAGNNVVGVLLLGWHNHSDAMEIKAKGKTFRDAIDVVEVLAPWQKLYANLAGQITAEFPQDLLKRKGIQATFMGVLDAKGILLMRNDKSTLYVGRQLAPESQTLRTTLNRGLAGSEVWLRSMISDVEEKGKGGKGTVRPEIVRMGFAPIVGQHGKVHGVFILGWELGDVHAKRMKTLTRAEVAYYHGKTLSSATLKGRTTSLDPGDRTKPGLTSWGTPKIKSLDIGRESYLAASGNFPEIGRGDFSYVVLSSVDKARAPFNFAKWMLVIFGVIFCLGFLGLTVLLRRYFILPIDELEKGVADIIAGNTEHTFGVPSPETEGLAYSLNVLMANLLGRPEPGEEEEGEEHEEGVGGPRILFSLGPLPDRAYRAGDSQLIPRLDETKDQAYERLFGEYLEAMKQLGEDTSGMTLEAFKAKLEVNERMICARLKCSEVRFAVVPGDEGVTLQPYPIS